MVPVYSGEHTLKELIGRCELFRERNAGANRQLLYELIFVCDEPIDDSQAVLAREAMDRDWIQYVSLACNRGQHMATAVGILYSSGDWILTLDEDLQHPPEILPELLYQALVNSCDLIYAKSWTRVHSKSIYRDLTSRLSKTLMKLFTREDYSIVSSLRLIRAELARSMAPSIDSHSYLDASLFAVISKKRRMVCYASFHDTRTESRSGYSFIKLLRHFSRLLLSAEPSGFRVLLVLIFILTVPVMAGLGLWLLKAFSSGAASQIAPGWLSLFFLGVSIHIFLLGYFIFALKMLAVLQARSSGLPPFMVINRAVDAGHLAYLQQEAGYSSIGNHD